MGVNHVIYTALPTFVHSSKLLVCLITAYQRLTLREGNGSLVVSVLQQGAGGGEVWLLWGVGLVLYLDLNSLRSLVVTLCRCSRWTSPWIACCSTGQAENWKVRFLLLEVTPTASGIGQGCVLVQQGARESVRTPYSGVSWWT